MELLQQKPKDNIISTKEKSNSGSTGIRLEKPVEFIIEPSAKQSCYLMRKIQVWIIHAPVK